MKVKKKVKSIEAKIGTILAGKYRVDAFIQKGGMARVYLGTHLDLGRKVALKIFHRHMVGDMSLVTRFLNEAKGTSRLQHRNIVDIIDVGTDEEGTPFIVMEYLEGETLKERLAARGGRLRPGRCADVMIQVLGGLHVAHHAGIIHRDLKPGNIFIAREADGTETAKILDFGIARFREFEAASKRVLTSTGTILGTPEFMSIEQTRGVRDKVDFRTDIYSCGVILYFCLTGSSPMKGPNTKTTLRNVAVKDVPPPSSLVAGLPPAVDTIVMKAMERDREKRFQNCVSFAKALYNFYVHDATVPAFNIVHLVSSPVAVSTDHASAAAEPAVAATAAATAVSGTTTAFIPPVAPPAKSGAKKKFKSMRLVLLLSIFAAAAILVPAGWVIQGRLAKKSTPLAPIPAAGKAAAVEKMQERSGGAPALDTGTKAAPKMRAKTASRAKAKAPPKKAADSVSPRGSGKKDSEGKPPKAKKPKKKKKVIKKG
jgi:tRNA A-37 threonylcarbamoyl transferase component Bud32